VIIEDDRALQYGGGAFMTYYSEGYPKDWLKSVPKLPENQK
jgi:hypothetical protein